MKIHHREDKGEGMFYIEMDGEEVGWMTYAREDEDHVTIEHTVVKDVLKGKGAGKQLMTEAVSWARANGQRVSATCSFALGLFEKVAEYQDVWEKQAGAGHKKR